MVGLNDLPRVAQLMNGDNGAETQNGLIPRVMPLSLNHTASWREMGSLRELPEMSKYADQL
jgi:hypothetical protein